VFPLSRKNSTFGTFFRRHPTKILKIGICRFGRYFFHRRKIHKRKYHYDFENVRYLFSQFKLFSGYSMDKHQ